MYGSNQSELCFQSSEKKIKINRLKKFKKKNIILKVLKQVLFSLSFATCLIFTPQQSFGQEIWENYTLLLKQVVIPLKFKSLFGTFEQNGVNYKLMKKNKEIQKLLKYQALTLESTLPPKEKIQALAFWINAYNFFTLVDMDKHYPVKSMKNIGWKKKKFKVNGKKYSLDQIEHKIIRPLKDPRIHFAINCASVGCPSISKEVIKAASYDKQMNALAENALKSPLNIRIENKTFLKGAKKISATQLFSWFSADFRNKPYNGVFDFVQKHGPKQVKKFIGLDTNIKYDWKVNNKKNIIAKLKKIAKKHQYPLEY